MNFKHRVIILSSLGFGLGVIVGVMICAVSATMSYSDGNLYLCSRELMDVIGNPLLAFTIQAFASGLYGVLGMGGSAVYSIEEWGLLKCTLTHYIAVIAGFFVLAFSMRWFTFRDILEPDVIITVAMITLAYVIIWMVNYLSCKAQLKEINKELDELKAVELKGVSRI